jgi:hypothetical protein
MRVLNALADLHEQLQALFHRQAVLVAIPVIGGLNPPLTKYGPPSGVEPARVFG